MTPDTRRKFGRTDLNVTAFASGMAPVGNIFAEIDEDTLAAMFDTAWQAGAPLEEPRRLCLSSKVGRLLRPASTGSAVSKNPVRKACF